MSSGGMIVYLARCVACGGVVFETRSKRKVARTWMHDECVESFNREEPTEMGRHRPHWRCTVCNRRRVPERGAVCYGCSQRLPNLPTYREHGTPPRSPVSRGAR